MDRNVKDLRRLINISNFLNWDGQLAFSTLHELDFNLEINLIE